MTKFTTNKKKKKRNEGQKKKNPFIPLISRTKEGDPPTPSNPYEKIWGKHNADVKLNRW